MNPTAIYSKSGKGVQEASGKTSILKRPDRAVLSAIDGRATLAEVAEKVGKPFDAAFEALITQLDKDGFVREVNAGVAPAAPKGPPAAKGMAAPPPPSSDAPDLDFSAIMPAAKPAAPPPPPKPSGPSPAELKAKADAEKRAKEQNDALAKARQEAEARAQAEREKVRKEAEEKIRAETEARIRKEAEEKMKADTDAKAKVIRAAAEAKIKAEAEAKKAREEADKARKEAEEKAAEARRQADADREKAEAEARKAREEAEKARKEAEAAAERARKEAEEKAKREQEEMRRQLEAERKAREEAEKKAREEAERARKEAEEKAKREQEEMRRQLEEERKRIEAERKQREEEDRKRREQEEQERAARRKKEEEEEQARRRKREEEERKEAEERAARRKREEEEEEQRREERARRDKEEEEERARRQSATELSMPSLKTPPPPPPSQPAASSTGGMDSLLADLDSFGEREEEERKAKEEADRKAREEKERKAREAEDKRRREEEERARKDAEDRRRREEEERARREEEERRQREEEERARAEADERKRKARQAMAAKQADAAAPARAADDDIGVSDDDLDMDDVKADEAKVSAESRRAAKERERERAEAAEPVVATKSRKPVKWGKPVALTLFVLLLAGIGAIHVMPVSVSEYENAASEALGQPVKLGSGRVSLFTGVKVTFNNAQVGGAKIATVRAHPDLGSLFGAKKNFSRIELEGLVLPQAAIGEAMFAKLKGDNFRVAQVSAKQMKLDGPLALPALDGDATIGSDGAVRSVTLRGPDSLMVKIAPKESEAEFDMTAGAFTVPFAPEVKFSSFGMKGTANRQGMNITAWDGAALTGTLSGTASIKWASSTWVVDGVITARGINAGVFAPALLSEGRGEGTGKFSMNGEPAQLAGSSRLDANFTINKGALSLFDLSRAIQTGGRQSSGRTAFAEMTGQATYDKGTVALRNVTMGAGALNAGISADIAESGALSGRIVADVKTATQTLRATFSLAGTVKEPQVK